MWPGGRPIYWLWVPGMMTEYGYANGVEGLGRLSFHQRQAEKLAVLPAGPAERLLLRWG